jgi:hypothetical protein
MVLKYHFSRNNDLGHYDAPVVVKEIELRTVRANILRFACLQGRLGQAQL